MESQLRTGLWLQSDVQCITPNEMVCYRGTFLFSIRSRSTLYGTQDGNDAKVNLGWWIDIRIVDNEKNISKMFEFEFTWRGQRYEGIWKQRTARLKFMKTLEIIIDEDGWRLNKEALDNLIEWTSWRFDVLKGSDVAESNAVRSRSVFLHFPVRVHLMASARLGYTFWK